MAYLEFRGISIIFPGVRALDGITMLATRFTAKIYFHIVDFKRVIGRSVPNNINICTSTDEMLSVNMHVA